MHGARPPTYSEGKSKAPKGEQKEKKGKKKEQTQEELQEAFTW